MGNVAWAVAVLFIGVAVSLHLRLKRMETIIAEMASQVRYLARLKEAEEMKRIDEDARLFMGEKAYNEHFGQGTSE